MAILIDSYSESSSSGGLSKSNTTRYDGQSFACSQSCNLSSIKLYLRRTGNTTGNVVLKVWAHTGTYGTDGKPTGAALATSDSFPKASIGTSAYALYDIPFSGANKIALTNGTKYCFSIELTSADVSNYIDVGHDTTSPTHGGNYFYSTDSGSTWTDYNAYDLCFYAYGEVAATSGASFLLLMT